MLGHIYCRLCLLSVFEQCLILQSEDGGLPGEGMQNAFWGPCGRVGIKSKEEIKSLYSIFSFLFFYQKQNNHMKCS